MTNEAFILLAVSVTLIVTFIVAIFITWLYSIISQAKYKKINNFLDARLVCYFESEDHHKHRVIREINKYIGDSTLKKKQLIERVLQYGEQFIDNHPKQLMGLYEETGITDYLVKSLSAKRYYNKAIACRKIGDLRIYSTEADLYKLHTIPNNEVLYNVLLALAKLGDAERLIKILVVDSNKINLSFRSIIEVIEQFNGSEEAKESLIKQAIEESDEYVKAILIKAAASGNYESLAETYIKYLESHTVGLRIACIRALSGLRNPDYEYDIINMLHDKEWEVRAAAAKGLGDFGTYRSYEPLANATRDGEWWVRNNAAHALVSLPGGKYYAQQLVGDEDRYSREAIAAVMER
ncbi:HEAT repeat domain-containing protein [Sporosarcina sp. PTS2304]|uniref:HEAT repeat domain-containing protein n=1 Tax=Sporosarcina sp. PTS2304 TaxID=2283194 RepID=UPI0013B42833|nr:HEAT repeat domain-containing protein [Sporosarcina sp. PTS2304]